MLKLLMIVLTIIGFSASVVGFVYSYKLWILKEYLGSIVVGFQGINLVSVSVLGVWMISDWCGISS